MNRVTYLKSLKLAPNPSSCWCCWPRSPTARRRITNCWRPWSGLEQANDRAAQARVAAAKLIQASKRQSAKAERKARAHRLIQQGVLFDLAGLEHRSPGRTARLALAAAKPRIPSAGPPGNRPAMPSWPKRAMRRASR
jgi:hypothetical protein